MARVVVVTGGGTGIGRAAAHELAGDGDVVVILGRRQGVLDLALDDLRAEHAGTEFLARSVDVGDPAQVDGLAPWLRAAVGPTVDVIVNSAAVRSEAVPPELTAVEVAQRFDAVLRVNLVGTYLVIHALEPMLRRPGGRIVNVISAAAVFAGGNELYSASKGGVMSMSYPLSKRLGADGITVNCVAPGFILSERWHERGVHDDDHPIAQDRIRNFSIKRLGRVEDVAAAIAYLASDRAGFVTGEVHHVNGGWVVGH
jgi:3-oxoacyl-[acyl-carrier protein] reductase